ncbi:hypothetical protein RJ640_019195 [Escallonia rubra]|uniref:Nuclear speckle splicing regulatory protein 1 N-terminal domain-containing protein n=1 Tax=Escallonia rubra TaxID=112253 RepID=A0AA88U4Q2_9ASTE|nr:hypothetical protein RJ640_019195 [Escallonia rubra]
MSKYGLQLRDKKPQTRPPLKTPLVFHADDDGEDDVEREISRHASKNKALKDIEEQHKKALEEDPSVFDYDGVYEEMKEKTARPQVHDRQERKREHEIVYDRKLAKERAKDDHLYEDKEKFVTQAYKEHLAEQRKLLAEEHIRELREAKEDVTKKADISDFYFNLSKNVAFGARETETKRPEKRQEEVKVGGAEKSGVVQGLTSERSPPTITRRSESISERDGHQGETYSSERAESADANTETAATEPTTHPPEPDHHKRSQDAIAAAKERFLARKKAKATV